MKLDARTIPRFRTLSNASHFRDDAEYAGRLTYCRCMILGHAFRRWGFTARFIMAITDEAYFHIY